MNVFRRKLDWTNCVDVYRKFSKTFVSTVMFVLFLQNMIIKLMRENLYISYLHQLILFRQVTGTFTLIYFAPLRLDFGRLSTALLRAKLNKLCLTLTNPTQLFTFCPIPPCHYKNAGPLLDSEENIIKFKKLIPSVIYIFLWNLDGDRSKEYNLSLWETNNNNKLRERLL